MQVLVTGATGFVGANVARLLLADGYRVRVLARPSSSLKALESCPVEVRRGDILEPDPCSRPSRAAAGLPRRRRLSPLGAGPGEIYRATWTAPATCSRLPRAGVERVVYTSSVGTLGLPEDGGLGTETTPVSLADMVGSYKRSKFLAERVAEEFAARGLPVVIVNPSNPIGPWEVKPTPTGQMIVDYLLGRMFGHARHRPQPDPCHRRGPRASAGGATADIQARSTSWAAENHSLSEIFRMLERITGIRAPRVRMPHALIFLVALANEGLARARAAPRVSRSRGCGWRASGCISAPKRPYGSSGCLRGRSSRP